MNPRLRNDVVCRRSEYPETSCRGMSVTCVVLIFNVRSGGYIIFENEEYLRMKFPSD